MKRGSGAGGLKVKALGQTLRDVGSSPTQHYTFLKNSNDLWNSTLVLVED